MRNKRQRGGNNRNYYYYYKRIRSILGGIYGGRHKRVFERAMTRRTCCAPLVESSEVAYAKCRLLTQRYSSVCVKIRVHYTSIILL